MIEIKKGLNIPLQGRPVQKIDSSPLSSKKVAVIGNDYIGMRPALKVQVGDQVKIGQELFACKKTEGVIFTSPGAGKVVEINRGAKRAFQSLVIELDTEEEQISFENFKKQDLEKWTPEEVKKLLVESGLWVALRSRPYSKIPSPSGPLGHSIFVTATDSNPLAADPSIVIAEYLSDFRSGLEVLTKLTQTNVYLCQGKDLGIQSFSNVKVETFTGPHPSGNVGTHIHFLDPVSENKTVWHINYQDVIAIGKLFSSGEFWKERILSLAGPSALAPRLIKSRLGGSIIEMLAGESKKGDIRIVSGPIFNGAQVQSGPFEYLTRYSLQILLLEEDRKREFLGWHNPGFKRFSAKRTFLGWLFPNQQYSLGTSTFGSHRAIVPVGSYEKVMPLDILATPLIKSLLTKDTDLAQELGILELDEEDLGLFTFVCPSKTDYGPILRDNLTIIEKEG